MSTLLRMNSTGPDVKRLQVLLNFVTNPHPPLVLDGIFGPKTRAEVLKFQQQARLSTDGIVGPLTNKALVAAVCNAILIG